MHHFLFIMSSPRQHHGFDHHPTAIRTLVRARRQRAPHRRPVDLSANIQFITTAATSYRGPLKPLRAPFSFANLTEKTLPDPPLRPTLYSLPSSLKPFIRIS